MFTVKIPFGPFDTGDQTTAPEVFAKVPGADLERLVRLGSLVPIDGLVAELQPAVVSEGEAELVAEMQKKLEDLEADRDLERESALKHLAERDALAKRVEDLEAHIATLTATGKVKKAAKTESPTDTTEAK